MPPSSTPSTRSATSSGGSAGSDANLAQRRIRAALVLLFVGSGCAALIYEIVWFQMLRLVIGASAVSLGILLASFMGGMFLGSIWLPRVLVGSRHPLRVYAALELAVAVCAGLLLVAIPAVGAVYPHAVPDGRAGILVRAGLAAAILLPPTILLGGTLPVVSRLAEGSRRGVAWMGYLYAGNTLGAVCGCALAGFYLLPRHDVVFATWVGMGIEVAVAVVAFWLARGVSVWVGSTATERAVPPTPDRASSATDDEQPGAARPPVPAVLWVIGLSGLVSIGSQVVWTRLLSLLLGSSTYTFSVILVVFLTALAIGSAIGSRLAGGTTSPSRALGRCQLGAAASIVYTAAVVNLVLPTFAVPTSVMAQPRLAFFDLARSLVAVAPGPIFWGAAFPLALASARRPGVDSGRLVGSVYASNTLGAIVGALVAALVLLPMVGTQTTQRLLVLTSVAGALVLGWWARGAPTRWRRRLGWAGVVASGGALALTVPGTADAIVAQGRYAHNDEHTEVLLVAEGLNASVAVTVDTDSIRAFRISGKVAASTAPEDMVLQRMLGHTSALFHEDPKTVLVVGFGAGVTAGALAVHPGIERIVICEIEALVTERAASFFSDVNHGVLMDPRVEVVHDDARHFLLTTDETFDVITSDPIHPWVDGAAALYTDEYFRLVRSRLRPGGVVTQWVPLYESTLDGVRTELATFIGVFPGATLWSTHNLGPGFDLVLAARPDGLQIDLARIDDAVGPPGSAVAASLDEIGLRSTEDLLEAFAGDGEGLRAWLRDAEVNRDRNLRLQYLAGLGLYANESASIHAEIFRHRAFPPALFLASDARLERLRTEIIGEIR